MTRRSHADKPHDPLPASHPAYRGSGFSMAECFRAETKVSTILRETLKETRVTAQQLFIAMLPALKAAKKIEITERGVRDAVQKVLDSE